MFGLDYTDAAILMAGCDKLFSAFNSMASPQRWKGSITAVEIRPKASVVPRPLRWLAESARLSRLRAWAI